MKNNKIRFTYEINTFSWEMEKDDAALLDIVLNNPENILWFDIELCFRKGGSQIIPEFPHGFRYGCTITHGSEIIIDMKQPADGVRMISSDQDVVQHIRIDRMIPEELYKIKVWCVDDDETFSYEYDFICPGYNLT